MRKQKNLWLIVSVLTIAALVLAGCGTTATEGPPAEVEPTAEPPAEEVTLKVWTWTWAPVNDWVQTIIDKFEAENPNVEIVYETFPAFGEGAYPDQVRISYAADTTPDIFFILDTQIGVYAEKDQVRPIDDAALEAMGFSSLPEMQDLYLPGALEGWLWDGEYHGSPFELGVYVLYANTEHLEEAGYDPDTVKLDTWEDLVEVSKDLVQKDADGNFTRIGIQFGFRSIYAGWNLTMIFAQLGGSMLSEDGATCTLDQPDSVKAVEYLVWLNRGSGISDPHFGTQEGGSWQLDWAAGLSSFVATNPAATMGYANEESAVYDKWRAYPLPHPEEGDKGNMAYGNGWVVSSNSEHPDEAWKFIGYLANDAVGALVMSGMPNGRIALLESEEITEIPAYSGYEASMEGMKFQPSHERYDEIAEVVKAYMQTLIYEGADAQSTLDQACADIDAILQRP